MKQWTPGIKFDKLNKPKKISCKLIRQEYFGVISQIA